MFAIQQHPLRLIMSRNSQRRAIKGRDQPGVSCTRCEASGTARSPHCRRISQMCQKARCPPAATCSFPYFSCLQTPHPPMFVPKGRPLLPLQHVEILLARFSRQEPLSRVRNGIATYPARLLSFSPRPKFCKEVLREICVLPKSEKCRPVCHRLQLLNEKKTQNVIENDEELVAYSTQ